MDKICEVCFKNPDSHSFKKIKEIRGVSIFYTCVSKAKLYNDTEGILIHYKNVFELNRDKEWVWIFDCKDMKLKHILNINIPIKLTKLITQNYVNKMKKIIIINPSNLIYYTLRIILPLFKENDRNRIKIKKRAT